MMAAACPQAASGSPTKLNTMLLHSLSYSFPLLPAPLFHTAPDTSFTHEYTQHFLSCYYGRRNPNGWCHGKFTCKLSCAANSCCGLFSSISCLFDNTDRFLHRGDQGLHFVSYCRN